MNHIADLESELMSHCLKEKGKWWANHFFRNKEVNNLYSELRALPLDDIFEILKN